VIQCPRCGEPIARRTEYGSHLVSCPGCQASFRMFTGRLASVSSRALAGRGAGLDRTVAGDDDALHQFSIALANGGRVTATFRARRADVDPGLTRSGDE